ncbi:MAG: cell division topological specificity factor MinE [Candidatus Gastranaerophilales bacterium]|nr:cell division topological specificity factor MinE [Candidatus Gastranaerophilales bacterium]
MKDIFSDLYDRVLSFFTTQSSDDTKVMAKSRLRTVLMQDRVGFSERAMQMLKDDLIESISRYLEIDEDSFDLSIDAKENATVLNLSIPVLRTKTDEEIDEALNAQEKEKIEKTQEIVGEIQELVKEKVQELAEQLTDETDNNEAQEETEEEVEEEAEVEEIEEEKEETEKETKKSK